MTGVQTCALPICDFLIMGVFLVFSSCLNSSPWLDPPKNIPLRAKVYLESVIGLITTLTLTRTLTLTPTLTLTRILNVTRTLNRALNLTPILT